MHCKQRIRSYSICVATHISGFNPLLDPRREPEPITSALCWAHKTINALRGHLAEFSIFAPQGPAHISRLAAKVDASERSLPEPIRVFCRLLLDGIKALADRIAELERDFTARRA